MYVTLKCFAEFVTLVKFTFVESKYRIKTLPTLNALRKKCKIRYVAEVKITKSKYRIIKPLPLKTGRKM